MSDSKQISFDDFLNVELRVGTVVECRPNAKARVPALVLQVDFGPELGQRTSSAQLTQNYSVESLVGRQVVCVMNFEPKRVAGVKSEVLVLGALDDERGTVLVAVEREVANGTRIA